MTPILGNSVATANQMATYLLSVNKNPKFSRTITVVDFCQLFLDVCVKEGVRGDIAFAQSCKETGNFAYGGDVKYTQNNFAGIGATGGGVCGCVFNSIEEGILAQAQHLKTYATKDKLNERCVDPRRTTWFLNTKGGTAQNWEELGGTWAVPGYSTLKYYSLAEANKAKDSYGYQILTIYNNILKQNNDKKEDTKMGFTNSPLVTYTKISPNKTTNRNHVIDTITIHVIVGQWTAKQGCDYFAKVTSAASANYVVGKDGSIGLCVEEKDRSWCTSNAANDHRAITIEVASDTTHPYAVTDKALDTLIKLVADICKRNGIEKLVWGDNKTNRVNHLNGCNMTVHRDYKAKACPGDYLYTRHAYIANEVNKLLGITTSTPVVSTPTNTLYKTYTVVSGDSLSGIGKKTGVAWKTIAELNGIKAPYIIKKGQVLKLTEETAVESPSTTSKPIVEVQALTATASKAGVQTYLKKYYGDRYKDTFKEDFVVDGFFGKKSKKMLAFAFQIELNAIGANLVLDGDFGSNSANAFNNKVGNIKNGSRGIFVTLLQCLIVGFGYNPNGIDGKAGSGFIKGLNKLFKAHGLSEDSTVNGSDINKIL